MLVAGQAFINLRNGISILMEGHQMKETMWRKMLGEDLPTKTKVYLSSKGEEKKRMIKFGRAKDPKQALLGRLPKGSFS